MHISLSGMIKVFRLRYQNQNMTFMKKTALYMRFSLYYLPLNYEQTSPLDVPLYAFGYPKAK